MGGLAKQQRAGVVGRLVEVLVSRVFVLLFARQRDLG
jgi:hypothetical protein